MTRALSVDLRDRVVAAIRAVCPVDRRRYGSVSAPRALSGGSSLQTSTERRGHSSKVAIDVL
jgi:hypothetical protein